ncbi:ABC transporter permease [Paenibacillus qinlingensis]|uniref:Aldouronate transport system permease protein n=1 Tax=Paenibacillus qinlingensis TaxID=1837343 RepID=A0ABU1NUC9_9BACL|nr:putative aldouronate transport system permease protein [Paenibacillus qinlingensis]
MYENQMEVRVSQRRTLSQKAFRTFRAQWMLYTMVLPGLLFFIVFKYVPLLGSVIAFQDFQILNGILKSPWVGLKHFEFMFTYPNIVVVLKNTLVLGTYQLVFGFPAPIILALLLNEVRMMFLKKTIQTFFYLPHFLSWVIVGGLIFELLSLGGFVNSLRTWLGAEPVLYMQRESFFRTIVVLSSIWKEIGWGAIIYLAAIAGINPSLYEAARVDGANRFLQIWYITLPSLLPTIIILLLLKIGNFLELGFDHIYVLLTPSTTAVGDIIDTYVYRTGILEGQYSFTTAVGLFKSIVGFVLLYGCNIISKKTTQQGLF